MVLNGSQSWRFSRRDLVALLGTVAVLFILATPIIYWAREQSRLHNCRLNLQQQTMALLSYEAAFNQLPSAMGGTAGTNERDGNLGRVSGWVGLLPYLDSSDLYVQIRDGKSSDGELYPAFGPAPWISTFSPWKAKLDFLRCPSAPTVNKAIPGKNYAFCVGDIAINIHNLEKPNGMFAPGYYRRLAEITDGLSNTIAICEIGTEYGRRIQGQGAIGQPIAWLDCPANAMGVARRGVYRDGVKLCVLGRGALWTDGAALFGLFNTILPPNGPTVVFGTADVSDGFYSAGSYHLGGVNVGLGDGSVRFVSDFIDVGDLTHPARSRPASSIEGKPGVNPRGAWGSLGTAAGSEGLVAIE